MTAERVLDRLDRTRPEPPAGALPGSASPRRRTPAPGTYRQLVALGVAGLLLHAVLVVTALLGLREVDSAHDDVVRVATAQRYFQDADMAHDLMRADVLASLRPDGAGSATGAGGATATLRDAVADFRADLQRVDAVALPAELERSLQGIRPLQESYADRVEQFSGLVVTDPAAARASLPQLTDEFAVLKEEQAEVTDAMSAEVVQRQRAADRDERAVLVGLVAAGVAAAVGMAGLTSLLHRLARRVDRAQAERQRLLQRAVEAGDVERRRLAQDLHDGVIQDLAGVAYAFDALSEQVRDRPPALALVQRAGDLVHRDVLALRTLLTDLYPPDLDGDGLEHAVARMLDECEREGLRTALRVSSPLALDETTAQVAYRVVRESLRNVVKHAGARSVSVLLQRSEDRLVVRVEDDGRGFDATAPPLEGHVGLRVLRDAVTDVGGQVELRSGSGGGTVVDASLPLSR